MGSSSPSTIGPGGTKTLTGKLNNWRLAAKPDHRARLSSR
jgi:hypothetical protein